MKMNLIIVFLILISIGSASLFPHIIWLYWDQGQNHLPQFAKACFSRLKSVHQYTDWKINLVDRSNIQTWLDKSEFQQLNQVFHGNVSLTIQSKSDFYRLFLIRKYGGIWLDVTVILHQNLNWLDDLRNNPYVINNDISENPQFFYFYINRKNQGNPRIQYDGKTIYSKLDGQNFMFAAPKQSRFVKDIIQQLKTLVMKGKDQYSHQVENLNLPFQYKPYYMAYLASDIALYRMSKAFHETPDNQRQSFRLSKFYNVWGISRYIGPYHQGQFKYIKSLFQNQPQRGDYVKYLTKIHHFGSQQFVNDLLSGKPALIQERTKMNDKQTFQLGRKYLNTNLKCLYQLRISQKSVVNKYLLSKIDRSTLLHYAYVQKDSQLPFICRMTNLIQLKSILEVVWEWIKNSFWLLLVIQVIIEYLFLFEFSKQINVKTGFDKQQFKKFTFKQVLLLILLYQQMQLIHSQYQLWILQSPTAILVGFFQFFIALIFLRNIGSIQSKLCFIKISFYYLVFVLLFFGYVIEYEFTAWKYKGPIYNYELLTGVNLQKLKESQLKIVSILILIISQFVFSWIKRYKSLYFWIQNRHQGYACLQLHDQVSKLGQKQFQ